MFLHVVGKSNIKNGTVDELVGPFENIEALEGWLMRNGFIPARKVGAFVTNGNSFVISQKLGPNGSKESALQTHVWAVIADPVSPDDLQVIVRSVA